MEMQSKSWGGGGGGLYQGSFFTGKPTANPRSQISSPGGVRWDLLGGRGGGEEKEGGERVRIYLDLGRAAGSRQAGWTSWQCCTPWARAEQAGGRPGRPSRTTKGTLWVATTRALVALEAQ